MLISVTEEIAHAMAEALTRREQKIIERRFGFHETERTLEDIGWDADLLISKERVRQLEVKALNKLRRYLRINRMYSFSDRSA